MNAKNTWTWLALAVTLFAFIFFIERHWRKPDPGPGPVLAQLRPPAVRSVQVSPAGQFPIRAERTNGGWTLTQPIAYPAQATRIEALLTALQRLTPLHRLTAAELRHRPRAETEYGLDNPPVSVFIEQENYARQIKFGALTAPGDQVFVRVVGIEDIYVVNAELLKLIPRATNDWRDRSFADLRAIGFDRLLIAAGASQIELQQDATSQLWRINRPIPARADNLRLAESLQKLHSLQVSRFIADTLNVDLEPLGLQPAPLELTFASGTNVVERLRFGAPFTNDAAQVYASRQRLPAIVTVPGAPLAPWRQPLDFFRDRQLVALPEARCPIEVYGEDAFTLLPHGTNGWKLAGQTFPVDQALADEFVSTLATMEIVEFVKDAVTDPELWRYGLTSPVRQVTLRLPAAGNGGGTNPVFAQVSFGGTNEDRVFAFRTGEDSVYAVRRADFERLPAASWQLRERRIWNFSEHDVARVVIRQAGQTRELLRLGTNSWQFAPGSQGIINNFAVEEAAHLFGELAAVWWVARGADPPDARHGFSTDGLSLTFELKDGVKHTIVFGGVSPASPVTYHYAAVKLGEETWVFEFPLRLYQLVAGYLTLAANPR